LKSPTEPRHRPGPRGFTLVEVLVALTIVAVALIASLRAVGALSTSAYDLRQRTLAQWSAENRLAQIRIQEEWPAVGQRSWDCSQAEAGLSCEEAVFATPNPQFRRVEVSVFPTRGQRVRLARLVGFAINAGSAGAPRVR
jgi:general secretion pathway protein I